MEESASHSSSESWSPRAGPSTAATSCGDESALCSSLGVSSSGVVEGRRGEPLLMMIGVAMLALTGDLPRRSPQILDLPSSRD